MLHLCGCEPGAAGDLPRVERDDALTVRLAIHKAERHRFERGALRWLARYCVERREATLAEIHERVAKLTPN